MRTCRSILIERKDVVMAAACCQNNPTNLLVATRSFHVAAVEALLARGAIPHFPDINSFTSLIQFNPVLFAMFHAREVLVPLVERGYHLDDRLFRPRTALGWAVRFGCVATVKLLLKHGSDVNQSQVYTGMAPLSECCITRRGKNIEMMTVLLEAGGGERAGMAP
jgi:ankyrin repeat protein